MTSNISSCAPKVNNSDNPDSFDEIHGVKIPSEFMDPIICTLMDDPVMTIPTGRTYNRSTIEKIQRESVIPIDPITNEPFTGVCSNRNLKECIIRFLNDHPDLKSKLEKEKSKLPMQERVHTYTSNEFMRLFVETDHYIFPPNQQISVEANKIYCWRFCASKSPEREVKYIERIFNNILLPLGKTIKSIKFEGITEKNATCSENKSIISLKSTMKMSFSTHRGTIITTIPFLFQRMISSQEYCFNVVKGQNLIFCDINIKDRKLILEEDGKNFYTYVFAHCPVGFRIEISANPLYISTFSINGFVVPTALGMGGDTGIQIKLKKGEEQKSN